MKDPLLLSLLCGIAYSVPIQTIGISTADVNSVPECTVSVVMQEPGQLYLLGNPEIGVHKCEMPSERRIKRGDITLIWTPPTATLLPNLQNTIQITDPNVIDYAGTGRSFGFGISGRWTSAVVTVNGRVYNFKPIVDMTDFAAFMRTWNPASGVVSPASKYYYINGTSKIYHREGCRYVTGKSNKVTNIDGLQPCKVCKPDDINNLLEEFLPERTE
jgi:hypothetical protein